MLSAAHLGIVLVIVLIIFGPGKLPDIGAALGKGIRNFKEAAEEDEKIPAEKMQQVEHKSSSGEGSGREE